MAISAQVVKELRDKTGAGMMNCKQALQETNGDFTKAIAWLRQKSLVTPTNTRITTEGLIGSYINTINLPLSYQERGLGSSLAVKTPLPLHKTKLLPKVISQSAKQRRR